MIMFWHGLPQLKAVALTAAVLLFAAGPAAAQHGHGGGGHGGGGHAGGGFHGGGGGFHGAAHVGSFHAGGFHGAAHVGGFHGTGRVGSFNRGFYGYNHYGYYPRSNAYRHLGYYPGFYGLGYYPNYNYYPYYGSGYTYAPNYYSPEYYSGLGTNDYAYTEPTVPDTSSYYPPADVQQNTAPADNKAHVRLTVPAAAEVWFDGSKTSQAGPTREFVSPALTPGTDFAYEIRARWLENGQPVDQTRKVIVRAGTWTTVDFTSPAPAQ
jgi:uncharacterized protein (TIGR03000 family)